MCVGRSGLHKIMETLKKDHFVIQDPQSKRYHLGPVVLRLGSVYDRFKGLSEVADPILSYLSERTGETVYISVWEGNRAFPAVQKGKPEGIYGRNNFIGKSIPINAGASAMLLCAFQPEETVIRLLEETKLMRSTPNTITDKNILLSELRKIREQGYALENETFTPNVICLSVPVFDRDGQVWCCLSLAAAKERADEEKRTHLIRLLKPGADELSCSFKFRK
jgi:DNA-binding IclR family transcriptional regulator